MLFASAYRGRQSRPLFLAVCTAVAAANTAAVEIPSFHPDIELRWDNTLRYNAARRVNRQDPLILRSPNNDDGDRNFDRGIVSNRLDLLSEIDLVYARRMGFRVSGAAWYDHAYRRMDNRSAGSSNHVSGGTGALGLGNAAKRWHRGLSGELLDAFLFLRIDIADMPLNVKLGRHTTVWGESLLSTIHGLNYGQSPIDLRKALSVPGTEAKELFVPRSHLSAQMQLTQELSIAGQYFLRWSPIRYPEGGSYLGFQDVLGGGESLITSVPTRVLRGADSEPVKRGDWGVAAHWSPDWLDGTAGMFVRRTADLQPQVILAPAVAALSASSCQALGLAPLGPNSCHINPGAASIADIQRGVIGQYHFAYGADVDIAGVSLSKSIGSYSLGAEIHHRRNMPLLSESVSILPEALAARTPGAIASRPSPGDTGGARGSTWHGVFNLLGIVSKTALFDAANWTAEMTWNRVAHVARGHAVYKGRQGYAGVDRVSRNFYGFAVNLTPVWYQAAPGMDLFLPMSVSGGISGVSAVSAGGNEGAGNYSIGIGADVQQKYRFDLRYVDFFGRNGTNAAGQITSSSGSSSLLKDRGFLAATFKTTF